MSQKVPDNNVAPRNPVEAAQEKPRGPGRPRVWENRQKKEQAHRAQRAERMALLGELMVAVRNAELEDPVLRKVALSGDEPALLRALIEYYKERNWCQLRWLESKRRKEMNPQETTHPKRHRRPGNSRPPS